MSFSDGKISSLDVAGLAMPSALAISPRDGKLYVADPGSGSSKVLR